jgi:hypothetical protein
MTTVRGDGLRHRYRRAEIRLDPLRHPYFAPREGFHYADTNYVLAGQTA